MAKAPEKNARELQAENHALKKDVEAWRILAENLQAQLDELREDAGLSKAIEKGLADEKDS